MEQQTGGYIGRRRIEPYWYVIAVIVVILTAVFANHLVTGRTPSRIAIQIEIFDFNVFWYGIFIVSGIALGSWVTARLAMERARDDFEEYVPVAIREQPLTVLVLSGLKLDGLEVRAGVRFGEHHCPGNFTFAELG